MRCAIYTRVSTENQTRIEFNSCESQLEKVLSYVKSQDDLEVYKVYNDPGYSAATLNRPALQEMLKDIAEEKFQYVLAYKIDRLTRSPKDFYTLLEFFNKYGVSFISTTQHFDTSSATGRLMRNIMLDFAQFEREMTSERLIDKNKQKAIKGMWHGGVPPYGYTNIDKKLVLVKKEAEGVKKIFETYLSTGSLLAAKREVDRTGFRNKKGEKLPKSTIERILVNPVYIGKILYKDKLYDGIHKAIIPEVDFYRVREMRRKKSKVLRETKIDRNFLLVGLIKCGSCGSIMTPSYVKNWNRKKTDRRYTYYYRCTKTYQQGWNSCDIKAIQAEKIEEFVIEKLKEFSKDKNLVEKAVKRANSIRKEKVEPLIIKKKNLEK